MQTGIQVFFQSIPGMTDDQVLEQELKVALRAEDLGFDYLLSPEHHFVDYSIAPDPLQFLTYVAGRTQRIGLVTGAVILPWNDPMRVAEKASLLDFLSDGRLVLGFGRGLEARFEPGPNGGREGCERIGDDGRGHGTREYRVPGVFRPDVLFRLGRPGTGTRPSPARAGAGGARSTAPCWLTAIDSGPRPTSRRYPTGPRRPCWLTAIDSGPKGRSSMREHDHGVKTLAQSQRSTLGRLLRSPPNGSVRR